MWAVVFFLFSKLTTLSAALQHSFLVENDVLRHQEVSRGSEGPRRRLERPEAPARPLVVVAARRSHVQRDEREVAVAAHREQRGESAARRVREVFATGTACVRASEYVGCLGG